MKYVMMIGGLCMLGFIGVMLMTSSAKKKPQQEASTELPNPDMDATAPPRVIIEKEPQRLKLDGESLQRVRNATRDTDPKVRWDAARLLVAIEDDYASDALFGILHRDSSPDNRRKALSLLADYDEPVVTRNIIRALRDTNDDVRIDALSALGQIGDYQAAHPIGQMMHDANERVRLKAINTLDLLEKRRNKEISQAKTQHAEQMRQWEEQVKQQKQR
ncbi:MAG: HEAT repeat domain-containing protein [Elusimicrobiota bacterium]